MSSRKYRIFCSTEGQFVTVWSNTPPTTCPTNGSHDVNPDSVDEVSIEETYHRTAVQSSNTGYVIAMQLLNQPSRPFQFVKVICSVQDGTASIRLYDVSNVQVLTESTPFSNVNPAVVELPAITYVPTEESIVEIQVKKVTGNDNVMLDTVILYR